MKIRAFFITLTCLFVFNIGAKSQFMLAEGTQITMADDFTKDVQLLKVGDIVLAFNNTDKVYEEKKVKSVKNTLISRFVRVTIETGMQIIMTADTPIWAERGWVSVDSQWTKDTNNKYANIKPCVIGEFALFYNITSTDYVEISIIQGLTKPMMGYEVELEGGGSIVANGFLIGHN